jgi:putative Flp pilus-assembly TadE/G-like protein
MRWVKRARPDEGGAVIVLMVAAMVAIVGMAAIVVDVGSLLDEKRQLQNGADAAAIAVAQSCGQGICNVLLAQPLADQNARDARTGIDPPLVDLLNRRVTVKARTMDSGGSSILPYRFAQVLTGTKGKTVTATATASWAGLKKALVVPITLSKNGFDCATSNNTVFGVAKSLEFHSKATGACNLTAGEMPGGFGWLRDQNDSDPNDCNVTVSVGDTVQTDPGLSGPPGDCDAAVLIDTDVLVPLFDSASGNGSNGTFHIYGFAMFHVTGYTFPSSQPKSGGVVSCSSNSCIAGKFIRFVGLGDYGGPNLGNNVALLS